MRMFYSINKISKSFDKFFFVFEKLWIFVTSHYWNIFLNNSNATCESDLKLSSSFSDIFPPYFLPTKFLLTITSLVGMEYSGIPAHMHELVSQFRTLLFFLLIPWDFQFHVLCLLVAVSCFLVWTIFSKACCKSRLSPY